MVCTPVATYDLHIAIDIGLVGNPWFFRNPDGTYQSLVSNVFVVRFYRGEHETEEIATWNSADLSPKLEVFTSSTPHALRWTSNPAHWEAVVGRYYRLARTDSAGIVTAISRGWIEWA